MVGATLQAADWSTYQPAHTRADIRKLKAAGIELIIPGAWHGGSANPHCRGDLKRARAEGLYTGTYAIVTTNGRFSIDKARRVCGPEWEHLSFCAVDMELDGGSVPQVQAAIDRIVELGQRPIIYTAHWFWHGRFGNPKNFKHIPLWNAYYDQAPDIDFASQPYGGWKLADVVGEQYIGTHTFQGLEMDRNTFLREFVEQQEDDMTFIGVGANKATLGTDNFESFRLYVTATGLVREKIPNAGEREALAIAGYPLLQLTSAQLNKYEER